MNEVKGQRGLSVKTLKTNLTTKSASAVFTSNTVTAWFIENGIVVEYGVFENTGVNGLRIIVISTLAVFIPVRPAQSVTPTVNRTVEYPNCHYIGEFGFGFLQWLSLVRSRSACSWLLKFKLLTENTKVLYGD